MYIVGTEGTLRSDAISGKIEVKTLDGKEYDFSTAEKGGHAGGDKILMENLRHIMVNDNAQSKAGIKEGLYSAITCFALDQANNTESVVRLAPWWDELDRVTPDPSKQEDEPEEQHQQALEYAG
jgi:hypothetical protein